MVDMRQDVFHWYGWRNARCYFREGARAMFKNLFQMEVHNNLHTKSTLPYLKPIKYVYVTRYILISSGD